MSVLFTDTMTVFNHSCDEGKDSWKRTIIRGVQWRHSKKELTVAKGVQTEERVESVTVDFSRGYDRPPYVEPIQYGTLPAEERAGSWTLNSKNGLDIIALGEIPEEIAGEDDIDSLRKKYPYVVLVSSVADNRNRPRLKHIRVVGK